MEPRDHYIKDDIDIPEPCNTCVAKYWRTECNRCRNCVYIKTKKHKEVDFDMLVPTCGPVQID